MSPYTNRLRTGSFVALCSLMTSVFATGEIQAQDWPQFRGPGALARGTKPLPLTWGDDKNIVWKATLPGPGASSPIALGDRIFITCFTGYGTSSREPGDMANLKRHLLALNL